MLAPKLTSSEESLIKKIWEDLRVSAIIMAEENPFLTSLAKSILLDKADLAAGLSAVLSRQNLDAMISKDEIETLFQFVFEKDPQILAGAAEDLVAITQRDPAATDVLPPFLFFKGFHALQTHRAAHWLWNNGQKDTALFLQNRSSVLYAVDIHPAARIGKGIMIDHAHGVVIGETAVVEDNVSMLHNTTLGGTGKERGDRHPKIRKGVMIGAGAKILGNIEIGEGASIAAGSVVLMDIPPHTTVAGVPAKIIGKPKSATPSTEMDQTLPEYRLDLTKEHLK